MSRPQPERVIELVAEVTRRDKSSITMDSRFIADLGANSLDVVELACLLEGEFNVSIPEARLLQIRTVGDVIQTLDELGHREG